MVRSRNGYRSMGPWSHRLVRATDVVAGRERRVHMMPPGPDRWKERSRTFPGIAAAMAEQWADPLVIW